MEEPVVPFTQSKRHQAFRLKPSGLLERQPVGALKPSESNNLDRAVLWEVKTGNISNGVTVVNESSNPRCDNPPPRNERLRCNIEEQFRAPSYQAGNWIISLSHQQR